MHYPLKKQMRAHINVNNNVMLVKNPIMTKNPKSIIVVVVVVPFRSSSGGSSGGCGGSRDAYTNMVAIEMKHNTL